MLKKTCLPCPTASPAMFSRHYISLKTADDPRGHDGRRLALVDEEKVEIGEKRRLRFHRPRKAVNELKTGLQATWRCRTQIWGKSFLLCAQERQGIFRSARHETDRRINYPNYRQVIPQGQGKHPAWPRRTPAGPGQRRDHDQREKPTPSR